MSRGAKVGIYLDNASGLPGALHALLPDPVAGQLHVQPGWAYRRGRQYAYWFRKSGGAATNESPRRRTECDFWRDKSRIATQILFLMSAEFEPAGRNSVVQFTTTHWSLVLRSREKGQAERASALEQLCRVYWPPIYSFLRRKGHPPDQAQDLSQEFFAQFLRREAFADADPARGRFRTFLLAALACFLIDERRRASRQKRGGGEQPVSLDEAEEEQFLQPASPELGPDQLFDRRWRLVLLQESLRKLEREFLAAGKERQFGLLKEFLTAPASIGAYGPIASELGISPRTLAVTIHRMRQRFREIVREQLAQTVTNSTEFEEELRLLFG
ncbi:MAG: sigma-70 family RNA polymerase sigma factor [Verrucomicrobiales bacterium]|nr:sigma-70 family RNA polymerase sigma factor [Verrucomicrobiales bacterium]